MRPIPPGSAATLEVRVSAAMTVHFDELGSLHPVYATYSMARHFEEAGRKLLLPYLDDGEDALGSELSVRHTASALPGMRVSVTATLERVEGRHLFCTLRAVSELGDELGSGHTVQVVLPRVRIEAGFEALRARWHGAAHPAPDDLSTLTALDQQWNEAEWQGDSARLTGLLAADWQGHFPDGSRLDRTGWLHTLQAQPAAQHTFSKQAVQLYGDTAISSGHLDLRAGHSGHRRRYLRVWARRGGRWQAVALHLSLAL